MIDWCPPPKCHRPLLHQWNVKSRSHPHQKKKHQHAAKGGKTEADEAFGEKQPASFSQPAAAPAESQSCCHNNRLIFQQFTEGREEVCGDGVGVKWERVQPHPLHVQLWETRAQENAPFAHLAGSVGRHYLSYEVQEKTPEVKTAVKVLGGNFIMSLSHLAAFI